MKFKNIFIILSFCFLLLGCQSNKLSGIEGKWLLNNKSLMIIKENDFYWYQNYQNLETNYYYGYDLTTLYGQEAIEAINVPLENREDLLKTHTYYLTVTYSRFNLNNKDESKSLNGKKSDFAFKIDGKDKVSIVNLITNEQFTAERLE